MVHDPLFALPLDEHDGPLRLLAPGDARPARRAGQARATTVAAP